MIEISANFTRTFEFPADLETSYGYYASFNTVLRFLPHISLVTSLHDNRHRLLYRSTELGIYRISIYCDLQVNADREQNLLEFRPLNGVTPAVPTRIGWSSLTGYGAFSSQSVFNNNGNTTDIDYSLQLRASLPVPYALKLIPLSVLTQNANMITSSRIQEIAEGFIKNSVREYTQSSD